MNASDFVEYCGAQDTTGIPSELQLSSHLADTVPEDDDDASPVNAMDDDCWKSTAVVDRDMASEEVTRVRWVHCVPGTPVGEVLLKAAEKGSTDQVREILSEHPDCVNFQDSDGYTPLHRSCYQGWDDITELLLQHGAEVDRRTEDGWTALHSAARWNKTSCARRLIAAGCDVNARSNGLQTPLHIAASSQACAQIIHLLLWHPDTDTSLLNNSEETAEKVAYTNSLLGPLFEMRHPFVSVDPLAI